MTVEIENPPNDTISRISFSSEVDDNLLIVSSWDKKFRIYNIAENELVLIHEEENPLLDCDFAGNTNKVVLASVSGQVKLFDIPTKTATLVGTHNDGIRRAIYHPKSGLIYTGGWDRRIKVWDDRQAPNTPISEVAVHGRIHAMDCSENKLVACDSLRRTYIFDLSQPTISESPHEFRDGLLQYQTRDIRCFPNNEGFAMSSIEGRVVWEYFDKDPQRKSKPYAFKCHRNKHADGTETVYPVHALAFHPKYGTFATGGGDGTVAIWDGMAKKRLSRLPNQPSSISSLGFNIIGTQIAVGVSSGLENFEAPSSQNILIIYSVVDTDVAPKA